MDNFGLPFMMPNSRKARIAILSHPWQITAGAKIPGLDAKFCRFVQTLVPQTTVISDRYFQFRVNKLPAQGTAQKRAFFRLCGPVLWRNTAGRAAKNYLIDKIQYRVYSTEAHRGCVGKRYAASAGVCASSQCRNCRHEEGDCDVRI